MHIGWRGLRMDRPRLDIVTLQSASPGRFRPSSINAGWIADRARWAAGPLLAVAALVAASYPVGSVAQELYVYPQKGQSADQQGRDRYECHSWAVQQTGADPTRSSPAAAAPAYPPPPQPGAPEGGLVRGAARGAAVGAVGGAIAGDAGKGAAIGAGTGALIGGMRRRDQQAREQQAQQNYERQRAEAQARQSAESANRQKEYNRAMTACLQARGYSVN